MQRFQCGHCGQTVFFENDRCMSCGSWLAYWPPEDRMLALRPPTEAEEVGAGLNATLTGRPPTLSWWEGIGMDEGRRWRLCVHRRHPVGAGACNWAVVECSSACDDGGAAAGPLEPADIGATTTASPTSAPAGDSPAHPSFSVVPTLYCACCAFTKVIPNLQDGANQRHWSRIESAKRRLLRTLFLVGLPLRPKDDEGDSDGLWFRWLEDVPGEPPVMTGHAQGIITLNVAEADDVERERRRVALREPQRTLLGHLRHEVSHFLFYRFVCTSSALEMTRSAFGDERADYTAALQKHYEEGPPPNWAQQFISAYASAHPAEDWAETCAHVLLIWDAVETAAAWGVRLQEPSAAVPEVPAELAPAQNPLAEGRQKRDSALRQAALADARRRVRELALSQWLPLAQLLNEMNRSLGLPDSYPFLLSDPVLRKMSTVHALLMAVAQEDVGPTGSAASFS